MTTAPVASPIEKRLASLSVRASSHGVTISGYASVFGQAYRVGDFQEIVRRGAFTSTLAAGPDVRLLIDHEGQPLARTKSGTLRLTQDDVGLRCTATLDPTDPDVQRLMPKMRRGDLDQMSFAFRVPAGGDSWSADRSLRTLNQVDLRDGDVSIVTYPASPTTSVGLEQLSARNAQRGQRRTGSPVSLADARRTARVLGRLR